MGESVSFQFCSVFKYQGKLYLGHQRDANGPRFLLFPPKTLENSIKAKDLGGLVEEALSAYVQKGDPIYALEWEVLNKQLIDYFSASSVSAFERKKRNVTVRREVKSGLVELYVDSESIPLGVPTTKFLGHPNVSLPSSKTFWSAAMNSLRTLPSE